MYPITKLIAEEMLKLGLTKRDLVTRMGCKNISKGLCNLHNFLYRSYYSPNYLKNILRVIDINEQAFKIAKYGTEEIIRQEQNLKTEQDRNIKAVKDMRWEITHLPYLHRKTDPPTPYVIRSAFLCFYNKDKFRFLNKSLLGLPYTEQIALVSEIIKSDYEKNLGSCDYYERITSYVFHKDLDTKIEFDVNGILVNHLQ